jgi:hypothetical protein
MMILRQDDAPIGYLAKENVRDLAAGRHAAIHEVLRMTEALDAASWHISL